MYNQYGKNFWLCFFQYRSELWAIKNNEYLLQDHSCFQNSAFTNQWIWEKCNWKIKKIKKIWQIFKFSKKKLKILQHSKNHKSINVNEGNSKYISYKAHGIFAKAMLIDLTSVEIFSWFRFYTTSNEVAT